MRKLIFAVVPALILWGCYPAGPDFVEDLDVVYTTFDNEYDFVGQSTYAMPDKIVIDVDIDNGDTTFVYMKDVFAAPLLAAIDQEMSKYGWQKITPTLANQPDVVITPAAIKSTTYFYSYWYDWWYGGWYGGYWGWYYPPYYTVSSYTTGSIIITMADPNQAEQNPIGESPSVWIAAANGMVTGSYDVSRATDAIKKAFAQSPYLKTN